MNARDNSLVCGRFGNRMTAVDLVARYPWLRAAPDVPARYNIAPTNPVVAIGPTTATLVRWGVDGPRGVLFNLRTETVLRSDFFRRQLLTSRVVVPVSHFYEWRSLGARRAPVAIFRRDGAPISLAGLLGRHERAQAVTILTTIPNRDLAPVHDRMPVVLSDDDARAWARDALTLDQLASMLAPCPDGFLELRPASPLVNEVANDGPQLLDPDALPAHHQLDLWQ